MTPTTPLRGPGYATILHRALMIGLAVVIGGGAAMVAMLGGPFLGAAPVARLLRYLLAGSGLLAVVAALLLLRPRLPPRAPGASQDQYWSQASTFVAALRLWMIVEGGGSIAAVGYILAGGLETIVVAGVALGILALSGPARLSGE